jgi:predicted  nucleic acid-binding Zn-ribbon protein
MSVKTSQELKGLQSMVGKLEADLSVVNLEIATLNKTKVELTNQLNGVKEKIKKMKLANKETVITEHAMLRYLERVKGLDLEVLKKDVLPDITRDLMAKMLNANGSYPAGTHQVVVKDNTVVTIHEE